MATSSELPDYYAVLGVAPEATASDVKDAYRRMVQRLHPDRNPGDREAVQRFRVVAEAWSVLGHDERRQLYDRQVGLSERNVERAGGVAEAVGGVVDAVLGARDRRPLAGRNRLYRLSVGFRDAMLGTSQILHLPGERVCERCDGRGFEPGTLPVVCARCSGHGELQARPFLRAAVVVCGECSGRGYRFEDPCIVCKGDGRVAMARDIQIKIPPGSVDGTDLRVRGAGEPGRFGGSDGDLIISLAVAPHAVLRRAGDGASIIMERPITVFDAITGGTLIVPTLDGDRGIRLAAGVVDGTVLRMPGYGVSKDGGPRGDQLVTVRVEFPEALEGRARAALEEASAAAGLEPFPACRAFEEVLGE